MKKILKNKKVIYGSTAVIVLFIISVIAIFMLNNKTLVLSSSEYYVEYGAQTTDRLQEYLDISSLDKETKEAVLENAVLSIDIENEDEKDYPGIGEYEGSISYKDETVNFKIIVQDTTAPTIVDFNPLIETYVDVVPNYDEIYQAEDLSGEVVIEIDDTNIDYSLIGEYQGILKATDIYDNIYETEFTTVVNEPILEVEQSEFTLTVGDTAVLSITVKGKDEKATFTSSDGSIATVDENGMITAISSGNVTITVSANRKEIVVNGVVNAKVTTSTNSNSSSSNSSSSSSNSSSSSSTTSTTTPSNTCTTSVGFPSVDGVYKATEAELKQYFRNTYGALGTGEYRGYGADYDTCKGYFIYILTP